MSPNTSQWGSRLTRYRPKASAHCIPSASPQNASAIPARLVFTRIGTPIHATGLSARLASRRPNRCHPESGHSASRAEGILPSGSDESGNSSRKPSSTKSASALLPSNPRNRRLLALKELARSRPTARRSALKIARSAATAGPPVAASRPGRSTTLRAAAPVPTPRNGTRCGRRESSSPRSPTAGSSPARATSGRRRCRALRQQSAGRESSRTTPDRCPQTVRRAAAGADCAAMPWPARSSCASRGSIDRDTYSGLFPSPEFAAAHPRARAFHAQRLFGDVAASDQHLASIRRQQAGQDLEQRRFARAIRPQQRADAARQVEGDVIEGNEFPKTLGDLAAMKHVLPIIAGRATSARGTSRSENGHTTPPRAPLCQYLTMALHVLRPNPWTV